MDLKVGDVPYQKALNQKKLDSRVRGTSFQATSDKRAATGKGGGGTATSHCKQEQQTTLQETSPLLSSRRNCKSWG